MSMVKRILQIEEENKEIFNRPGLYKNGKYKAKIPIDDKAPRYMSKIRPLPVHLEKKVEEENNRLLKEGRIERVTSGMVTRWSSPIHVI